VLELGQLRLQNALALAARLFVGAWLELDGRLRDVERAPLPESGDYLILRALVRQDLDLPHPAYSHPMLPPGCGCSGRDDFEDLLDAGLYPLRGAGAHAFDARPALGDQSLRLDLGLLRGRSPQRLLLRPTRLPDLVKKAFPRVVRLRDQRLTLHARRSLEFPGLLLDASDPINCFRYHSALQEPGIAGQ